MYVLPLHAEARPVLSVSKILEVIYALNAFASLAPREDKKLSTPKCLRKALTMQTQERLSAATSMKKKELHVLVHRHIFNSHARLFFVTGKL